MPAPSNKQVQELSDQDSGSTAIPASLSSPGGSTLKQRARPYMSALANIDIKYFLPLSKEDPIDEEYVKRLCLALRENIGTDLAEASRTNEAYRIPVVASSQIIRQVKPHHGKVTKTYEWHRSYNAEALVGVPQLQALRDIIERESSDCPSKKLLLCEVYNHDKLPQHLHAKLQLNPFNISLATDQGQVWMHLRSFASNDSVSVDQNVLQRLCPDISASDASHFVTLWGCEPWRRMATRFCKTKPGLQSFKASTFVVLSSLRLDEYLFAVFKDVLCISEAYPGTKDFGLVSGECTPEDLRLKEVLALTIEDWADITSVLKKAIACINPGDHVPLHGATEDSAKNSLLREELSAALSRRQANRSSEEATSLQKDILDLMIQKSSEWRAAGSIKCSLTNTEAGTHARRDELFRIVRNMTRVNGYLQQPESTHSQSTATTYSEGEGPDEDRCVFFITKVLGHRWMWDPSATSKFLRIEVQWQDESRSWELEQSVSDWAPSLLDDYWDRQKNPPDETKKTV